MDPPLDHPGLHEVADTDLARRPTRRASSATRRPSGGRTASGRRPRRGPSRRSPPASRCLGPTLDGPLVEAVDPQLAVVGLAEGVELHRGLARDELRGGRVLRREVRDHVPVLPSAQTLSDSHVEAGGVTGSSCRGGPARRSRSPSIWMRSIVTAPPPGSRRGTCCRHRSRYRRPREQGDRSVPGRRARLGHEVEVRRFPEGTKTAEAAARAVGCDVGQIVKSLVFVAGDEPVLALTSGANRVDTRRLASLAGASDARRADPEEARAATGFAVGGTPPFGHPDPGPDVPRSRPARVRGGVGGRGDAGRGVPRPRPTSSRAWRRPRWPT